MTNVRYPSGRAGMADGSIIWTTGVFRAQLWRGASYVPTHTTVAQLVSAGATLVASSDRLVTSVTAGGACDAADVDFPSIAAGPVITVMTIAQTSGPAGGAELPTTEQRLLAFLNSGRNLPLTPTGRSVRVRWSETTARVFVP